ncbi:MAG: response regulator [Eubacteriaceae bacterium]|nr:response regulator [Eubacteriaceae bacterium]
MGIAGRAEETYRKNLYDMARQRTKGIMNITICDDCQVDLDIINSLCETYATENNISLSIMKENNPLKLNLKETDLLILDIRMPEKNGIEIQRQLEITSGKPLVIFITNYREFSISSYGANVTGFIEKPVRKETLFSLFERARGILSAGKIISWSDSKIYNTRQIQYIIMDKGVSKAILDNDEISVGIFKTIKQWNEELKDYGFIRINQSCLLNCQYIDKMTDGRFILKSGKILSTSRREKKLCEDKYIQYLERNARFL